MRFASVDLMPYFKGGSDESSIAMNALLGRSKQRQGAMMGEGAAARGGIKGLGTAKIGEMEAEQILMQAPPAGSGAMAGMGQMAEGLLGGLSSKIGGGGGGGALGGFGVTPATSGIDFSSAFANPNFMTSLGGFGG